jgi:hypothetical protein
LSEHELRELLAKEVGGRVNMLFALFVLVVLGLEGDVLFALFVLVVLGLEDDELIKLSLSEDGDRRREREVAMEGFRIGRLLYKSAHQ